LRHPIYLLPQLIRLEPTQAKTNKKEKARQDERHAPSNPAIEEEEEEEAKTPNRQQTSR
jgi:hypothetical protein